MQVRFLPPQLQPGTDGSCHEHGAAGPTERRRPCTPEMRVQFPRGPLGRLSDVEGRKPLPDCTCLAPMVKGTSSQASNLGFRVQILVGVLSGFRTTALSARGGRMPMADSHYGVCGVAVCMRRCDRRGSGFDSRRTPSRAIAYRRPALSRRWPMAERRYDPGASRAEALNSRWLQT